MKKASALDLADRVSQVRRRETGRTASKEEIDREDSNRERERRDRCIIEMEWLGKCHASLSLWR